MIFCVILVLPKIDLFLVLPVVHMGEHCCFSSIPDEQCKRSDFQNDIFLPGHCEVNEVTHCDGEVDLVGKPDKLTGKGKHNAHLKGKACEDDLLRREI